MAAFDRKTPPVDARGAGIQPLPPPSVVAIIFKACYYETGLPKTWLFTHIDHVAIVQGRVHLLRDGYGLVCDLPYEEVPHIYAGGGELVALCSQETRQASNDTKMRHASAT